METPGPPSTARLLRAAWVAPMNQPLIRDGVVAVREGRITDVGPAADVIRRQKMAPVEELGDVLLIPGLVNAHVHLELSDLAPGERPASFIDWLLSVIAKGPPPGPVGEARVAAAIRRG